MYSSVWPISLCLFVPCTKCTWPLSSIVPRCFLLMKASLIPLKVLLYVPVDAGALLALSGPPWLVGDWNHGIFISFFTCFFLWLIFIADFFLNGFSTSKFYSYFVLFHSLLPYCPEGTFCAVVCSTRSFDRQKLPVFTNNIFSEVPESSADAVPLSTTPCFCF